MKNPLKWLTEREEGVHLRGTPPVLVCHPLWSGCGVGPGVGGANCTMQFVESDGRRRDRRCDLVGRLVVTKGIMSEDGVESSRLVIDSMSKPR